jgi:tRNA 2-thiouridine synthesizing protein A
MTALINRQLDLRGYHEPVSIAQTRHAIDELRNGEILLITTNDRNTLHNMDAWCRQTGNTLLQSSEEDGEFTFMIRKSRMLN